MGMEFKTIKRGLERFEGVYRRFQKKYSNGVMLIDDYAHHPTEVQATLQAAHRGWPDRRVIAVFQPHLYSRTQELYKEFGLSFFDAEVLVVTDVYPSREKPIEGITGALIANTAEQYGHKNVHYVHDKKDVASELKNIVKAGDIIITMGAGDIYRMGDEFAEWLEITKPFKK
jgi:UDP-N-acetylmuramate--alanine ligase